MPRIKFTPENQQAYDRIQIQVKVLPGVRERLLSVSSWQDKLRSAIDSIIAENLDRKD